MTDPHTPNPVEDSFFIEEEGDSSSRNQPSGSPKRSPDGVEPSALRWEAQRGQRLHRYGRSVTTFWPESACIWWSHKLRRWITDAARLEAYDAGWDPECSSHSPRVRTLRAFKRHLRRHASDLAGFEVVWVSRYEGHNVSIVLPAAREAAASVTRGATAPEGAQTEKKSRDEP